MSHWLGAESLSILHRINRRPLMARPLSTTAPFDARQKRSQRHWPLGLLVFLMVVANATLWLAIYAITHGQMVIDPRFL